MGALPGCEVGEDGGIALLCIYVVASEGPTLCKLVQRVEFAT